MEWWRGLHSASGDALARPEGANHMQKRCVCVCVCVCVSVFAHVYFVQREDMQTSTQGRQEKEEREQESKQNSCEMSWPSGFFFPRGDCQFKLAALNRLRVKPEVQGLPRTQKR